MSFETPITPDEYVAGLYQEYGLGDNPSLDEIQPIATQLLSSNDTLITGVEMVLGRRVDAREFTTDKSLALIFTNSLTGEDRFALLLLSDLGRIPNND